MFAGPVRMTVKWQIPPQELGPITAALHALMVEARREPGYVCCNLSAEMGNHAGLRYVEEWSSEEDLKRQVRSNRFAKLAELMERATEHPSVEFSLQRGTRGLDYAEEVRRSRRQTE